MSQTITPTSANHIPLIASMGSIAATTAGIASSINKATLPALPGQYATPAGREQLLKATRLLIGHVLIGAPLGRPHKDGAFGQWMEDFFEKDIGLMVNRANHGCDLVQYGVELKTRKRGTNAALTVGSMTANDIIKTPWAQTHWSRKIDYVLLLTVDESMRWIHSVDLHHLGEPACQQRLETAYEYARSELSSYTPGPYVPRHLENRPKKGLNKSQGVFLEVNWNDRKKTDLNGVQYRLRIRPTGLGNINHTAAISLIANILFP
jgi:hypothetical protein